jgi:CHAT domain-containing protein
MSAGQATSPCLAPEVIAAFAEGKLERPEIRAVLEHLDRCPACMDALDAANLVLRGEKPRAVAARWRTWSLAAAALIALAALLAFPFWQRSRRLPAMARLAALLPRSARAVEPRISGGFAWAPYRGSLRQGETASDAQRLKLAGVTGELVEAADRDGTPRHQHDAGVALLLLEQPLEAAARLRAAAQRMPQDASAWSDLSAALAAAALRLGRPSLYPEALAAADRALRLAPSLPEALFNRALVLERLGLSTQARAAWRCYLEVDVGSSWAAEAQAHLARLPATTGAALFERDRPRLEAAAKRGDAASVAALVGTYPQLSRIYGELDYLAEWGEALQRGDLAGAAGRLKIARGIGDALVGLSGESLLAAAVRSIDAAAAGGRAALAAGHVAYRLGRITYGQQRPTEAEPELREAARHFAAAGSPMSLVARYFAANVRFDRDDIRGACAELTELLAEADARPGFAALGAQVRWELARCHVVDEDWTGAVPLLAGAAAGFRRLGERHYLGFIETMLASALVTLGRLDDSWASRIDSFAILSAEGLGDRLAVSLGSAARMEMRTGRLEPAGALLRLEQDVERGAGNEALLSNVLVREAVLRAQLGDDDRAAQVVSEASAVAESLADPRLRAEALADVAFAKGAATLHTDPARAREQLAGAIDFYRRVEKPFSLPECYLWRARASLLLGDPAEALRDLESGAATVERHRIRFGGSAAGTGVIDAATALIVEALRLESARGDAAGAFAFAERAQAQLAPASETRISLAELRRRLAGSDAAVLELALLPEGIMAVAVSERDAAVAPARQPLTEAQLATLAARATAGESEAARTLYELLIRPSQRVLAGVRHLVVVAGPAFDAVPYAAVYDAAARRYLIETMSVAVAPSASALRAIPAVPRRSVAAFALPSGDGRDDAASLPEATGEIAEIGRCYREAAAISAAQATFPALLASASRADVLHIASHAERLAGQGDLALVFAARPGGSGQRVAWGEVAAAHLPPTTVVCLAACETLRRPALPQVRALSLGGGFLAAGASDVIGTLAPIADLDARELFREVHRYLAAGENPSAALRHAQVEALAREPAGGRPAWRAVALLTRRLPTAGH